VNYRLHPEAQEEQALARRGVMGNVVSSRDVSRSASSTLSSAIKSASSRSRTIVGALAIGAAESSVERQAPKHPMQRTAFTAASHPLLLPASKPHVGILFNLGTTDAERADPLSARCRYVRLSDNYLRTSAHDPQPPVDMTR